MKTSETGIELIKKFEGCRLTAYKDPGGTWTIGYGHTSGVKSGDTITQCQADAYLREDLEWAEDAVMAFYPTYHWNQNEFDALASFAYNLGSGSVSQLTGAGSRDRETISEKMLLYVNCNGSPLEGLVNRRKQERALFLTPCPEGSKESVRERLTAIAQEILGIAEAMEW